MNEIDTQFLTIKQIASRSCHEVKIKIKLRTHMRNPGWKGWSILDEYACVFMCVVFYFYIFLLIEFLIFLFFYYSFIHLFIYLTRPTTSPRFEQMKTDTCFVHSWNEQGSHSSDFKRGEPFIHDEVHSVAWNKLCDKALTLSEFDSNFVL